VTRAIVSSFNLADVDRVRALDPAVPDRHPRHLRADATWRAASSTAPAAGATAPCTPTTARSPPTSSTSPTPRGLRVNTWTVDDPDRIRQLAALASTPS
jgi:glycerophosphoryl diester phosphodiesterase